MKETKLSLLRSFGSEQFSMTITIPDNNPAEIEVGINQLNESVFKMLKDTEARSIKEREVLVQSAEARTASFEAHKAALAKETEAKKALGKEIDKGIKNYNKQTK